MNLRFIFQPNLYTSECKFNVWLPTTQLKFDTAKL